VAFFYVFVMTVKSERQQREQVEDEVLASTRGLSRLLEDYKEN